VFVRGNVNGKNQMDKLNTEFWRRQRTDHGPVLPPPDSLDDQWSDAGNLE
jgi:hypothetical protein